MHSNFLYEWNDGTVLHHIYQIIFFFQIEDVNSNS